MTTPALALVITTLGLGRFSAAQAENGTDLAIVAVGLTDTPFVVAPSLTALPGEFRRVATIAGEAVGDNIVHMIVRDDAPLTYQVRGFGLFLADGTLFAAYGQAEPIGEKSSTASLLLAIDIAFPTSAINNIVFGDTNFLNPPATTTTKGVVELATLDEAQAGDVARVTTGAVVKAMLAGLSDALSAALAGIMSRTIYGSGLVTGGGDLTASRTLTVTAATPAETGAGVLGNKAVTPSGLAPTLQRIADLFARRITVAGLVTGGGDLTANREIKVTAASAAQIRKGDAGDVVATPVGLAGAGAVYVVAQQLDAAGGYRVWSDGLKECWGQVFVAGNATVTVSLPVAHDAGCTPTGSSSINQDEQSCGVLNASAAGFQVRNRNPPATTFYWHTKGH
jgi:hypothetical protein